MNAITLRRVVRSGALGCALLVALPASSELCVPDRVPAATLLVPYFEVPLAACGTSNPRGTTVTIHNTDSAAHLAQVHLWTDYGVAFTSFVVYLPGRASHEVDLGRFFCSGYLPSTGSAVSLAGPLAEPNVEFPGCNATTDPAGGVPVYGGDGAVPSWFMDGLRSVFTGGPWIDGYCAAQDHGDTVVRGYATVDVVEACSFLSPSTPGYFDSGIATKDNVLLGEYAQELDQYLVQTGGWRRVVYPAVHIEADPTGAVFLPGDDTFYGRFVALTGADGREPLPSQWFVRRDPGTTLTVWRQAPDFGTYGFACGTAPSWYPLSQAAELNFDRDGELWELPQPPIPPPTYTIGRLIPLTTQRIDAGPQEIVPYPAPPATFEDGWDRLLLFTTGPSLATGQSWVTVETGTSVLERGHHAIPGDSSCMFGKMLTVIPVGPTATNPASPMIFADGFESQDASAWSQVSP